MLDRKNLVALIKAVAAATPSESYRYNFNGEQFTYKALDETLRNELNQLVGTPELYEQNKGFVFRLMEEVLDEIVPTRLMNAYAQFAEIRTFAQGTKPVFTRRTGRTRAKQFITRVGLAGVYEVFKLGSESFEVGTSAIGGAAQIGFEEYLDGRVDFAELTQIVMEGMDELIYREIAKALMESLDQLPPANRVVAAGYDEAGIDYLISTASAYGEPTIYCTREFAVKMLPDTAWVSDRMKEERWNTGYLANYKGIRVVILPQSLEDESNTRKVIDPGYVWIIPTAGNSRPVKVAFEGTTHIRERNDNDDWSRDIQVYRKVGVGVMMTNNIFSYVDTELAGKLDNVNPSEDSFPVGEEAVLPFDTSTSVTLGNKTGADFIEEGTTIEWSGTQGSVVGTLKYVQSYNEFGGEPPKHFYVVHLPDQYAGQPITVSATPNGLVKTATDQEWVLGVNGNDSVFVFSIDGIDIFTVSFENAVLAES